MTNKQPHNSLTASWNGRSRGCSKIRGNRITYPLIFMTSSNITFSPSLSFTLPLFFLSFPPEPFPLDPLFQNTLYLQENPFSPLFHSHHSPASPSFSVCQICESRACIRTGCPKAAIHPKKDISIRSTTSTTANTPTPRHVVYLLNQPPVGDCVLFLFFFLSFSSSFSFLSLVHPCISFRTLIRVPPQAKAALQDNRAVT